VVAWSLLGLLPRRRKVREGTGGESCKSESSTLYYVAKSSGELR